MHTGEFIWQTGFYLISCCAAAYSTGESDIVFISLCALAKESNGLCIRGQQRSARMI